jgi:CBS-domain-containing membrane protein
VAYCYEDEDCARARQLMDELDLNYLPVVDRDMRIVGIFSREEVEQKMPRPSPRAEPPPEESGHWISKL